MHGSGSSANMNPSIDPVRKTAWFEIIGPFLESVLSRTEGCYFTGHNFSAIDLVVGMDLYIFHERMMSRGDGDSWLDPVIMPRLSALASSLASRPARKFAFSATLKNPTTLASMRDFGVEAWLEAREPAEARSEMNRQTA
ncbi:unnamed protein product [Symbiodinium pilosum]|uniref:GST C-terminal domain-containing protein n=1 Tax=Symbiodinium pilosum TaxID=2952 RepID=A0A812JZ17_SYMPI|nr:unnamed protein product [Symbiodinium pilosum]